MQNMTAEQITAAARVYNAEFPEAAAEIEAGTPMLSIYADTDAKAGRSMRIVADFGVVAPDGGWIAAGDPTVIQMRTPWNGKLQDIAARRVRQELGGKPSVPVRYRSQFASQAVILP